MSRKSSVFSPTICSLWYSWPWETCWKKLHHSFGCPRESKTRQKTFPPPRKFSRGHLFLIGPGIIQPLGDPEGHQKRALVSERITSQCDMGSPCNPQSQKPISASCPCHSPHNQRTRPWDPGPITPQNIHTKCTHTPQIYLGKKEELWLSYDISS
jgi:hypothetical protein